MSRPIDGGRRDRAAPRLVERLMERRARLGVDAGPSFTAEDAERIRRAADAAREAAAGRDGRESDSALLARLRAASLALGDSHQNPAQRGGAPRKEGLPAPSPQSLAAAARKRPPAPPAPEAGPDKAAAPALSSDRALAPTRAGAQRPAHAPGRDLTLSASPPASTQARGGGERPRHEHDAEAPMVLIEPPSSGFIDGYLAAHASLQSVAARGPDAVCFFSFDWIGRADEPREASLLRSFDTDASRMAFALDRVDDWRDEARRLALRWLGRPFSEKAAASLAGEFVDLLDAHLDNRPFRALHVTPRPPEGRRAFAPRLGQAYDHLLFETLEGRFLLEFAQG